MKARLVRASIKANLKRVNVRLSIVRLSIAGRHAGTLAGAVAGGVGAVVAGPGIAESVCSRHCGGWSIRPGNLRTDITIPCIASNPIPQALRMMHSPAGADAVPGIQQALRPFQSKGTLRRSPKLVALKEGGVQTPLSDLRYAQSLIRKLRKPAPPVLIFVLATSVVSFLKPHAASICADEEDLRFRVLQ